MSRTLHKPVRAMRRWLRCDSGAALVEFALLLPTLMLVFAVAIEGSRTFWSYQSVIAGVRDASRYVGRATPSSICAEGGSVAGLNQKATEIVAQTVDGQALLPPSITVTSVMTTLDCYTGDYRLDSVPVARVTAVMEITYPFASVFGFIGIDLETVSTSVFDTSRVFGA